MSQPQLIQPVGAEDHSQGGEDFQVTLVEYGDFECPHCGAAYPVLKRVKERMGERLRFVYRHFPLADLHPHAMSAAEASESVATLAGPEAFWRMHNLIFENQRRLQYNDLANYASLAGAAGEIVLNDLEEALYRERVLDSFMGGVRSGVNGTPTLFIDGVRYNGPRDEETLVTVLSQAADRLETSRSLT